MTLVGGGEEPQGLHPVAEELDPQGVRVKRREHVHDAPANGEVARLLHNGGPQVPAGDQLRNQLLAVDLLTGQDQFGVPADLLPRNQPLQQRLDRNHHDGRHLVRQHPVKNPYAFGGRLVVVGKKLERKLVVGWEKQHRNGLVMTEKAQVFDQPLAILHGGHHHQHRCSLSCVNGGDDQRALAARNAANLNGAIAGGDGLCYGGSINYVLILIHKRSKYKKSSRRCSIGRATDSQATDKSTLYQRRTNPQKMASRTSSMAEQRIRNA